MTLTESIGVMSRWIALQPVISPTATSMSPALLLNVLFSMKKNQQGWQAPVEGQRIVDTRNPSLYDNIGPNM